MLRKIETQEEKDRRSRRNQFIIGGILILIMVFSTLGYSLIRGGDEEASKVSEQGFDFVRSGGLWKAEIGGGVFGFEFLPSEVSNVSVSGIYNFGTYQNQPLYVVNANNGVADILTNLGNYVLRYQDACFNESSSAELVCNGDLPSKGCDSNLIIFESGNETAVWQDRNCVFISGDSVKGADAFLYRLFGITG